MADNKTWQELLKKNFPSQIRTRGNKYAQQGCVVLKKATQDKIHALVEGDLSYTVEITSERQHKQFRVFCSCPHFSGGKACKHLWAAIIAADEAIHQGHKASAGSEKDNLSPDDWESILGADNNSQQYNELSISGTPGTFILYYDLNLYPDAVKLFPYQQYVKKNGTFGRTKEINYNVLRDYFLSAPDEVILNNIAAKQLFSTRRGFESLNKESLLMNEDVSFLLPHLAETKRCRVMENGDEISSPLQKGSPYEAKARFYPQTDNIGKKKKKILFNSYVVFSDQEDFELSLPFREVERFLGDSPLFVISNGQLHQLEGLERTQLNRLRKMNYQFQVARKDIKKFVQTLEESNRDELVRLPSNLELQEHHEISPVPVLQVSIEQAGLQGRATFDYNGLEVGVEDTRSRILDMENWQYINRNLQEEKNHLQSLLDTGFNLNQGSYSHPMEGGAEAIQELLHNNWRVEAKDKKPVKSGKPSPMRVKSGQDWFDVEGSVSFEQASIPVPRVIRSFLQGYRSVQLDDGSIGILPFDWLQNNINELSLGLDTKKKQRKDSDREEKLHYHPGQALALDKLTSGQEDINLSEHFIRIRDELKNFQGVQPREAPEGFQGDLRYYQKEALGWFSFLERFEFGGILADDMGLGKTIQVLALLEDRRQKGYAGPSLVVAPTSLILNWEDEAKRFVPELKVLAYFGQTRKKYLESASSCDLIVTSYGILRQDIQELREIIFDYYILDESQAIKNYSSQTFKAAKQISANHKLCLTGTPLENHLGELWSQMDFLNPGLLKSAKDFEESYVKPVRQGDSAPRESLHRLIKPFILRRCKEEVESELPEKVEQVIKCNMSHQQQSLYQQLKDHYRDSILSAVDSQGMNKTKMQVLEGLLRLRQIACHPCMIDSNLEDSGKMEKLRELLEEVVQGGHKALIFSQFTKFLKLLAQDLDEYGFSYHYLDGSTSNKGRKEKVNSFQSDPDPKLFLISLKAGGTGFNLTAADYVFILDPWWNPAVEMQAVDRTHRIGQDKKVFTYRLITRESVEEKVQTLQEQKKELVQTVLSGSKDMVQELSRQDLEVLFS